MHIGLKNLSFQYWGMSNAKDERHQYSMHSLDELDLPFFFIFSNGEVGNFQLPF